MFLTIKLSFNEDILAFFDLATVWATFSKIWAIFFTNLLVTLIAAAEHVKAITPWLKLQGKKVL